MKIHDAVKDKEITVTLTVDEATTAMTALIFVKAHFAKTENEKKHLKTIAEKIGNPVAEEMVKTMIIKATINGGSNVPEA